MFRRNIQKYIFFVPYNKLATVSVLKGILKVLGTSLKIVLTYIHFIVNLYNQVKITTFRQIHFYLSFDVSSATTLIVKKLL